MTHIIPPGEDHLHEITMKCPCFPLVERDNETGELLFTHLPLTINLEVLPEQQKEMDSLFG